MKSIGIIGFGRFGRLAAKYLKSDFDVYAYDKQDLSETAEEIGVNFLSIEEVCKKDIILLCVPISEIDNIIKEISSLLNKDSIVIDTCSVKEYPVAVMKKHLPGSVEIIGTHPMFGPDSASGSLKGRSIVLSPIRINNNKFESVKNYLENKGLNMIESTPEEHDRQIARSLCLTHVIGRTMIDMGLSEQDISTLGYERLLKILETVKNDTWQLFLDMNRFNKYAEITRKNFISSLKKIDNNLK
ncbi:prephenate dehydrogenase/arogenate dehydrogenase family protein [Candidatus Woesearchaeota archaeon]|nr:prephenate dehydrogenase/arogenate dehydrogenase family protein [Candidatus Woesearchaeota archaeon]